MLKISAYQNVNLPQKVQRPLPGTGSIKQPTNSNVKVDFKSALDKELDKSEGVSFSAHARARQGPLHLMINMSQARVGK